MEWNVRMETASPDDVEGAGLDAYGQMFGDMLAKLEPYGAAGGLGSQGWDVTVTVEAESSFRAIDEANTIILGAINAVGLPSWRVVEVCAVEAELEWARNALPTFPDIVGAQEVIAMLGVTKQRLSQLRVAGRFPEPILELGATPIWLRSGIEGFVETWDRRPGRPRTLAEAERAVIPRESRGRSGR